MELKTIKFMPYRGQNLEIHAGKKTIVNLEEDRLTYALKFTQKVIVTLINGESVTEEKKEINTECDETGFIMKSLISGVAEYIDTEFNDQGNPYMIHKVDVAHGGAIQTFTFEKEEDKHSTYKLIDDWSRNK